MTYELFFILHIDGACITALVGAYALVAMWNNFAAQYKTCALILGALATLEISTGTILSIISVQISAASVCDRVALYLALVGIIEGALFARMKKGSLVFPFAAIISPVVTSLVFLGGALAYGF